VEKHTLWFFGHACIGYLTTTVILRRENPNQTVLLAGILSGMLPDADVLFLFWNKQDFIKYHRTFSHSLVYCLIAAVLLQIILYSSYSKRTFSAFFASGISHLIIDAFMDSYNPYGIALLWPFSNQLFSFQELDWLLGFGFVTSDIGSFITSVVASIIAIFLALSVSQREKKGKNPFQY